MFQKGDEAEKKEVHLLCFRETRARVDNVQTRGMCSTRGQSASSQDLQKHIAAPVQTAPVPSLLAKKAWLLPDYTSPALPEPVITAALWKCVHAEHRDRHSKAAAD